MKKSLWKLAMCGLMIGSISAGTTVAQPGEGKGEGGKGQRPDPAERFARMDADGNGEVSLEEFKVAFEKRMAARKERMGDREGPDSGRTPPTAEEAFERMDENEDGVLTRDELKMRGRRGRQGGKGERRGGGGD